MSLTVITFAYFLIISTFVFIFFSHSYYPTPLPSATTELSHKCKTNFCQSSSLQNMSLLISHRLKTGGKK